MKFPVRFSILLLSFHLLAASLVHAAELTFTDTFTRTNSTTLGNGWSEVSGDFTVTSNELRNKAQPINIALLPQLNAAKQSMSADFAAAGVLGNPKFGVILRYDPVAKSYYVLYRQAVLGSTGLLRISKVIDGTETELTSTPFINPTANAFFKIGGSADGITIKLDLNGVTKLTVQDATFTQGSIGVLVGTTGLRQVHRIDNVNASVTLPPTSGFIQVIGSKLTLNGDEYIVKGANYIGGRYINLLPFDGTYEHYNIWMMYAYYDEISIEDELKLLKTKLGINTIRILTPSPGEINPWVSWQGWPQWFLTDGSINPIYLNHLQNLLDIAQRNNIKVQLELLHNINKHEWKCFENSQWIKCSQPLQNYTATTASFIPKGSQYELFYLNYISSVVSALKNHPALLSYEVGNEMLIYSNQNFNYWQTGWYEQKTLSFINRMIQRIRALDPNHLITSGEIVGPLGNTYDATWWWPSPEFSQIADIDGLNGSTPYSLYSLVDYISPHFYQNYYDIMGMVAAVKAKSAKPVVIGEFGYAPQNLLVPPPANFQALHFKEISNAMQQNQLSGMQPWAPLPIFDLTPGTFRIDSLSPIDPITVLLGPPERKIFGNFCFTYALLDHNLNPIPAGAVFSNPATPLTTIPIRSIKIKTPLSNSWIAWAEVDIRDQNGNKIIPVSVTVSSNSPAAAYAFDGNRSTVWNAQAFNGSIMFDLGEIKNVSRIGILPVSDPNPADTTHKILISTDNSTFTLLKKFISPIYSGQWLEYAS